MKVLFIGLPESIHAARWMSNLSFHHWEKHFFPSNNGHPHPEFVDITVHGLFLTRGPTTSGSVRLPYPWLLPRGSGLAHRIASSAAPAIAGTPQRLARLIQRLKPDVLHSLGLQHGAYVTLQAKQLLGAKLFPPWIVSTWGSDVYLFGRLAEHRDKVRAVLAACDYVLPDCQRDASLVRDYGFRGQVLPSFPVFGGFTLPSSQEHTFVQPSARRTILIKGYQNWHGRALVGLEALRRCADVVRGYQVALYLASDDVRVAAEIFSIDTGIPVTIVAPSSFQSMLNLHGQARISIGLSLSDGLPASVLEAMAMGSLPIQSDTASMEGWVTSGETALIVPPEDPQQIAAAIRRALSDDHLVDRAAEHNRAVIANKLDPKTVQQQLRYIYEQVAVGAPAPTAIETGPFKETTP
jgi:hypothetical protein